MSKVLRFTKQIKEQIRAGAYGQPGEQFLPLREMAQRLGVSLATAQKINARLKEDGVLIADSTNPAVLSEMAVEPAGNEPKRIGLLVPHIDSPFFGRLAKKVQSVARGKGYQVLMASSEHDFDREREIVSDFLDIGVDGLLICPGLDGRCPAYYRQLIERGIVLVMVSRRQEEVPCDFVAAHNYAGGMSVARHFMDRGFRDFGYLAFGPRLRGDDRLEGFRAGLSEGGFTLPDRCIVDADGGGILHGKAAMEKLDRLPDRPRAVFAFNDLLAVGALQYCQDQGIAVPDSLAIAGFDNLAETRVTVPPLTTVEYPVYAMANLAVQCLLDKANGAGDGAFNHVMLEPRLVVRGSTDPDWHADTSAASQSSLGVHHPA